MDNDRTVVANPSENNPVGDENQKDEQEGCNILFAKDIQEESFTVRTLANAAPIVVE